MFGGDRERAAAANLSSQESRDSPSMGSVRIGNVRKGLSMTAALRTSGPSSRFAADFDLADVDRQFQFLAGLFGGGVDLDVVE